MRRLQEDGRARALSTAGVVLAVETADGPCPQCSGPTGVQKTVRHRVVTLEHGAFVARETVRACTGRCTHPSGRLVIRRSEELARQVASGVVYGYDLEVHVGLERFLNHRQREEIRGDLQEKHGISLSSGQVSILAERFLRHLEELHATRAPAIREVLAQDGGYPLHIDATGEDGRGTLFIAYAGWREWVLGAWKLTTERADKILPCLRVVVARFGAPCAIMRDLGRAVTQAAADLANEIDGPDIPILACHLHFVRDIGKDLLDPSYDQMRKLLRRFGVKAGLRALARDLGRRLGERLASLRDDVGAWVEDVSDHRLPSGPAGLAAVRSLAQWALDYTTDGQNRGYPFDRPYLDLYRRCFAVRRAVDAFLRKPPDDLSVQRALQRLACILDPTVNETDFASAAATLTDRGSLVDELREALRLIPATPAGKTRPQEEADELKDIEKSLNELASSLRERRPERGPAQRVRQAIDIILDHLDRHGQSLWGHVIQLPESTPGGVRVVERTNNLLEGYFHRIKHNERRRSGRKNLAHDFECLPAAAALAPNLNSPDYVRLLCGSLEGLPAAFAALDGARRADRLASVPGNEQPRPAASPEVATASLPRSDRPLVRKKTMKAFIDAAARSRAPRYAVPPAG